MILTDLSPLSRCASLVLDFSTASMVVVELMAKLDLMSMHKISRINVWRYTRRI